MLRITTIKHNGSALTLKLEGKIFAEWVALLETECRTWIAQEQQVVLDMADVTYIDDLGVMMIRSLPHRYITLTNRSDFIDALLDKGGKP